MLLLLMLFFFFLFVLFLLRFAVDFVEEIGDGGFGWLGGLCSLLVGVMINPTQPRSSLADIFHDDEIVAVCIGPFDPIFEARVLELQNIINLYLVHPLLIINHDLSDVCLEEEFFVDDEATVLLDQQPWRMDLFTVDIVLVLVAIVAWPVFVEAGGAYELDLAK